MPPPAQPAATAHAAGACACERLAALSGHGEKSDLATRLANPSSDDHDIRRRHSETVGEIRELRLSDTAHTIGIVIQVTVDAVINDAMRCRCCRRADRERSRSQRTCRTKRGKYRVLHFDRIERRIVVRYEIDAGRSVGCEDHTVSASTGDDIVGSGETVDAIGSTVADDMSAALNAPWSLALMPATDSNEPYLKIVPAVARPTMPSSPSMISLTAVR